MSPICPSWRMQQQMQKISITHTDIPQLSTIPQHTKIQDKSSSRIQQEQQRRRPKFSLRGSAKEALPSPVSINTSPPKTRNPDKTREIIPTSRPSKIVRQQHTSINKLFKQKKRELATQQQKRKVRIKIDKIIPPKLPANESEDEGKSNGTGKQSLAAPPTKIKSTSPADTIPKR